MNEARHATAIHEAGRAVVCYLLGRQIIHVVLLDERRGETMTDSSFCDDSLDYSPLTNLRALMILNKEKDPKSKNSSKRKV